MGAFLCDNCHLTALARYACGINPGPRFGTTLAFFDMFLAGNVRSLEAAYTHRAPLPDNRFWEVDNDNGPCLANARPCLLCESMGFDPEPVVIVNAADCYEHQACEHPDWRTSDARKWTVTIREHALSRLGLTHESVRASVAYQSAGWGFRAPHADLEELSEQIECALTDGSEAAGDLLDATDRLLTARNRHDTAMRQKIALTRSDLEPNSEEPQIIRRYLLALHDLIAGDQEQTRMILELAQAAGVTL